MTTAISGSKQAIVIRGWRAVPRDNGGFNIYAPGNYDTYRGAASTLKAALDWLNEVSGVNYDALPAVKKSELVVHADPEQPIPAQPIRPNDTFQLTHYYYDGKFLGTIQVKNIRGTITKSTCCKGYGIRGSDLRWLCKENGLRLIETTTMED